MSIEYPRKSQMAFAVYDVPAGVPHRYLARSGIVFTEPCASAVAMHSRAIPPELRDGRVLGGRARRGSNSQPSDPKSEKWAANGHFLAFYARNNTFPPHAT